ncbi:MAG: flippase-like domain-containing protein [Flavobacteriales bacterium]|nr:flippase-like domain-containing protein [Flavobacteriales bacterium]
MGRSALFLFRWGIFLLACVFLYAKLGGPKGIVAVADQLVGRDPEWVLLGTVLVLMLINWGIEAVKWQRLVRSVDRLSFGRAFMATIAGTSVGLVTVNRTGDFLGRILFLAPGVRIKGSFVAALGSIAQFVVTLIFGCSGLFALLLSDHGIPWSEGWITWTLITLSSLVTCISLVLYLVPGFLRQLLLLLPFLHRFERPSAVLAGFQRSELVYVLALSAVRYAVFNIQFMLLLHACGADVPVHEMAMAIPVVYLIATLVPSIMITELGIRGSVAIAVFAPFGGDPVGVLIATTILWTINVAIPAITGSLIMVLADVRTER